MDELLSKFTAFLPKVLLVLLVLSLLCAKIALQRQELLTEKEKNSVLTKDQSERDALIQQLQEAEAENKKRLTQLHTERQRITHTLAEREAYIEQLQHNDQHIQLWADTPLPDAIVRLRHRHATTGASDYAAHLPND